MSKSSGYSIPKTAGLISGAVKANSLERVTIDTTVQEKAGAYPTDARQFNRSRERLVRLAGKYGVRLRQNCNRLGPRTLRPTGIFMPARRNGRGVRSGD